MPYEVEDLKIALANLEGGGVQYVYTEHYVEKISERSIDEMGLDEKIESESPKSIEKLPGHHNRFLLSFSWDEECDLKVFVDFLFPTYILLLTVLFERRSDDGEA